VGSLLSNTNERTWWWNIKGKKVPEYPQNGNGKLPEHIKDMLSSWPASGSGLRAVHRHMLTIADRLRHYVDIDEADHLIRTSMPRRQKRGEVEDTVAKAYDVTAVQKKTDAIPDFLPDLQRIENIVAERIGPRSILLELEERSHAIPARVEELLAILFPPGCFICVAHSFDNVTTLPLANLYDKRPERHPWLVPNPMTAPYAIDSKGVKHRRCLANTGPRRFIICDFDIKEADKDGNPTVYAPLVQKWRKHGVTIQDAAAALIDYLAGYGPLVLVVYSGNVSLQAWFYAQGESESARSNLRDFFESAIVLGADKAGWNRCQLFRMPGATHPITKRQQTVHFFNPSKIKQ
jgi:hypothetical protein